MMVQLDGGTEPDTHSLAYSMQPFRKGAYGNAIPDAGANIQFFAVNDP